MHPRHLRPGVRLALIGLAALLAACNGDGGGDDTATVQPQDLCVQSACGTKTRLLHIPDAENLLFTPDGRLFVTGGRNVYEVTRSGDTWNAAPLFDGTANFTGLARVGSTLYANSFDGNLYAATLGPAATMRFAPIHALGLAAPNGLVAGPAGELYIVNGPIPTTSLPDPKIVRVRLDPANPLAVAEQSDWMATGLSFPNGITRIGSRLYVADANLVPPQLGVVREVEILADGSAGAPREVASLPSILDDLSATSDHLLVSLFATGAIALVNAGGIVEQTDPLSFDSPSAVRVGVPPLFAPDEIVVTEKGVLQEMDSNIGNALSVFRPDR